MTPPPSTAQLPGVMFHVLDEFRDVGVVLLEDRPARR